MNKKVVTKEKLRKLISENEESMTYSVTADDQNAVDKAKQASKTDGVDSTIELTTEGGEDDLPEIPDEEKMERGEEYGVYGEDFDKLMEELKNSKSPKIKLGENIKPRIKKNDLINYIKNKK